MKDNPNNISDKNCLFKVNYNISVNDYIGFNQLLLKNTIVYRKKRAYFVSGLLVVMSVILGIQAVVLKRTNQYFLDFLILFVFAMGIYNILFYKKILPSMLCKNAKNVYKTTKYFEQDLVLKIFEDRISEFSGQGELVVDFSSIDAQHEDDDFLILTSDNNKMIVVKKSVLKPELYDFLKNKIKN